MTPNQLRLYRAQVNPRIASRQIALAKQTRMLSKGRIGFPPPKYQPACPARQVEAIEVAMVSTAIRLEQLIREL